MGAPEGRPSLHRGPYQRAARTEEAPGAHSVLGGACGLCTRSLLIWGLCACGGWRGRLGDASKGTEAVGVDGWDQSRRLDAQRVRSVLIEQGDGGLLGGQEAGGQVCGLHLCAPGQGLAGPGICFRFPDDHQLVGKLRRRRRLFWRGGGVWVGKRRTGTHSALVARAQASALLP